MNKLKIGVDITHISRFVNKSNSFIDRLLSADELVKFDKLKQKQKQLFLARSWAIKEAIFKADNQYYKFKEIDIKKINNRWIFKDFIITISHEKDILVAFVINMGE
ncbi:4'-phosphopantetheinyl transferase superfamily protein [Mycoplasma sp. 394]